MFIIVSFSYFLFFRLWK